MLVIFSCTDVHAELFYGSTEVLLMKSLKKNWMLAHTTLYNSFQEIVLPLASLSKHASPCPNTKSCINQCPFKKAEAFWGILCIWKGTWKEWFGALKAFIILGRTMVKNVSRMSVDIEPWLFGDPRKAPTNAISCLLTIDITSTACILLEAQACCIEKGGQSKLTFCLCLFHYPLLAQT